MHFARKEIVMKIERVNENQIRCTLNQADLASRQLKISELAYGSEKAKELFRDMMQQASYEVGFEADDIPLMIEAIPISSDCIVLIITKVENPEELDTRFSKFSPLDDGEYDYDDDYSDIETIDNNSYNDTSVPPTAGDELDADTKTTSEGGIIGDDLMNLFSKVRDYLNNSKENTVSTGSRYTAPDTTAIPEEFANSDRSSSDNNTEHKAPATPVPKTRIYSFESMDDFIDASKVINHIYNDPSYLYKKSGSDRYYLIMQRCCCSSVDFNKVCNILSEYALKETSNEALFAFFKEHGDCIIAKHAINIAANL